MTSLARIVTGPDAAPTLVLLHGITGSAVSLAEAIDHWVGRGYRVVAGGGRLTLTLGARGYYWLSVDRTEPDDAPQGDHDNHPTEEV